MTLWPRLEREDCVDFFVRDIYGVFGFGIQQPQPSAALFLRDGLLWIKDLAYMKVAQM